MYAISIILLTCKYNQWVQTFISVGYKAFATVYVKKDKSIKRVEEIGTGKTICFCIKYLDFEYSTLVTSSEYFCQPTAIKSI